MNRDEFEATLFRYGNGTGSLSAVQSALTVYTREVKAAAWYEGKEAEQEAQFLDGGYGNVQHAENPYEKEQA